MATTSRHRSFLSGSVLHVFCPLTCSVVISFRSHHRHRLHLSLALSSSVSSSSKPGSYRSSVECLAPLHLIAATRPPLPHLVALARSSLLPPPTLDRATFDWIETDAFTCIRLNREIQSSGTEPSDSI
jgi:hypothetical protein